MELLHLRKTQKLRDSKRVEVAIHQLMDRFVKGAVQRNFVWFGIACSNKYLDPNLIETSIKLVNVALAGLVVVALQN